MIILLVCIVIGKPIICNDIAHMLLILYCRKYEEIYPPDVNEFVYITDDTYTKKQVGVKFLTFIQSLVFQMKQFCLVSSLNRSTLCV